MSSVANTESIKGRRVVIGVSASIAAYKAADIASQLVRWGVEVRVAMTPDATRIIPPLTLQTISRHPVSHDLWGVPERWEPEHIALADWAELFLVAPATAHILACFAHGMAPDVPTCVYLATLAPVILAPAMNGKMLAHGATQKNLDILRERGAEIVEPDTGMLACGYEGNGKLASVETICEAVRVRLSACSQA